MRTQAFLVLLFWTNLLAHGQNDSFLERTKLALKSGNSQKLAELMAEKIQFGNDGEAETLKNTEAEKELNQFFKNHLPSDLTQLFEGKSKDGKKYFIGKLSTKSGNYRVSVYWKETPQPRLISIDISPE
jgi:hypothetical protein